MDYLLLSLLFLVGFLIGAFLGRKLFYYIGYALGYLIGRSFKSGADKINLKDFVDGKAWREVKLGDTKPGEFTGNEFIKENYKKCTCGVGPWTPISGICRNCSESLFGEKQSPEYCNCGNMRRIMKRPDWCRNCDKPLRPGDYD